MKKVLSLEFREDNSEITIEKTKTKNQKLKTFTTFARDMKNIYTLHEANQMVRRAIEGMLSESYWVQAELSEVRESRGHCYMELVETDQNALVARASAKCWASTWRLLRSHFERVTGQPLHKGMRVMISVSPQFHELYGFSWIVDDINPEFTLGDMARKRQAIIDQLKQEGVFDLQRDLHLPMFAQRIAVISSETAAGYGDFCRQLHDNPYDFLFHVELFSAVMQGDQVEPTIIEALNRIYNAPNPFDCVVIIRGGGATTDLSGFDTLALAENVANFPLPVIVGIGHDRDETILDMIAHTRVKTPTAAAAFLIDHLAQVAERLERYASRIPQLVSQRFADERHRLDSHADKLNHLMKYIFERHQHQLQTIEYRLRALDPQLILKRGYSLTMKDGKVVRNVSMLREGDIIETRLADGRIESVVSNHSPLTSNH